MRIAWALGGLGALVIAAINGEPKSTLIIHSSRYGEEELKGLRNWLGRANLETQVLSIDSTDGGRLISKSDDGSLVDNLIMLADKIPNGLDARDVVEFVKRGGNLLWVVSSELYAMDDTTRGLAFELGRIFDLHPATITDYHHQDDLQAKPLNIPVHVVEGYSDEGTAARVFPDLPKLQRVEGEKMTAKSHRIDPANPLVFPILTARSEAIGVCPEGSGLEKCIPTLGTDNVIASALESRLGARAVIITSDSWLVPSTTLDSANSLTPLMSELMRWTFKETGDLRLEHFEHWRQYSNPATDRLFDTFLRHDYHERDKMMVRACFTTKRGPIQPSDVQVELILLDPVIRVSLLPITDGTHDDGLSCLQSKPIQLPEYSGVFNLRLRYQRRGWPHIIREESIAIRPKQDHEWPRFYPGAIPYYLAWISTIIAALVFTPALIKPYH